MIISNHSFFKKFLVGNMMSAYDDELRIFLITCLKKVWYLRDMPENILQHLSVHMKAMEADMGSYLV